MSRRRVVAGALLAATVGGVVLWRRGGEAAALWPRQGEVDYAVELRARTHASLPAGLNAAPTEVSGRIALAGELKLRRLEGGLVGVGFAPAPGARWEVMGRQLLGDDAAKVFAGQEAVVELDGREQVKSIGYAPGTPSVVRTALHDLIGYMSVTPGEGKQWSAVETTPAGRATTQYRRAGERPLVLERRRAGYQRWAALGDDRCAACSTELGSQARLVADEHGLERASDEENIRVVRADGSEALTYEALWSMVRGRRVRVAAPARVEVSRLERHAPDAPVLAPPSEETALRGWAQELTLGQLRASLLAFAHSGQRPADPVWLVRAAAYLRLHPDDIAALTPMFDDAGMRGRGRSLLMDVLTATGSPPAQAAMRAALDNASVKADPAYLALVQRLGMLGAPEPASVAALARLYDGAQRPDEREAAARALGASVRALGAQSQLAQQQDARLRHDLDGAREPGERRSLVAALGNAGTLDDTAAVARLAKDEDPGVRAAVATALRGAEDPGERAALLSLVSDDSAQVATAALSALSARPLSGDDVARLRDAVVDDRVAASLDDTLVTLLAHNAGVPNVRPLLERLLERAPSPLQRGRLQLVLAQLPQP